MQRWNIPQTCERPEEPRPLRPVWSAAPDTSSFPSEVKAQVWATSRTPCQSTALVLGCGCLLPSLSHPRGCSPRPTFTVCRHCPVLQSQTLTWEENGSGRSRPGQHGTQCVVGMSPQSLLLART